MRLLCSAYPRITMGIAAIGFLTTMITCYSKSSEIYDYELPNDPSGKQVRDAGFTAYFAVPILGRIAGSLGLVTIEEAALQVTNKISDCCQTSAEFFKSRLTFFNNNNVPQKQISNQSVVDKPDIYPTHSKMRN